jgi:hypothetical protein
MLNNLIRLIRNSGSKTQPPICVGCIQPWLSISICTAQDYSALDDGTLVE